VDARSIMGLMMLAAGIGASIEITADGPEAAAALEALCDLVGNRFEEER
jgi:phosphocarrier protein